MPILNVEIVMAGGETLPPDLSKRIADAAARVFGTPSGRTWVLLHRHSSESYAENGVGLEPGSLPMFVRVLKAAVPAQAELEREVSELARAVARACDRPVANVHVLYEPAAAGRNAFGGDLLKG